MRTREITIPIATLFLGLYLGTHSHDMITSIENKIHQKVQSALGIHEILTQKSNQACGVTVERETEIKFSKSDIIAISEYSFAKSSVYATPKDTYIVSKLKGTPFESLGTEKIWADCLYEVKVGYNSDDKYFYIVNIDDKNKIITLPRPPLIISSVEPLHKEELHEKLDILPFTGFNDNDISDLFFYEAKDLKENDLPKNDYLGMFQEMGDEAYKKKAKEKFSFMQNSKYKNYSIELEEKHTNTKPFQEILDLRDKSQNQ